jgi:hypothetical protein
MLLAVLIAGFIATCAHVAPASATAPGDPLSDGTRVARWTLKNGLTVVTRDVPSSGHVAVTVAYRIGSDSDPRGHEGTSALMAELIYTSAAGNTPERTRDQMPELRPLGWTSQVSPRYTLWSEIATVEQFPGVLSQAAERVRGVTVTQDGLRARLQVVRADQGMRYFGSSDVALYHQAREVGLGHTDDALLRRASLSGVQATTVKEAQERLHRLYVPANAVLSLAGDLSSVDVTDLVTRLFADIPGGAPAPEPPMAQIAPAHRTVHRADLKGAVGVACVIAPALTDSLNPSFYLSTLLMGDECQQTWGAAKAPLTTHFMSPFFADPALAHFFPPVSAKETDASALGRALDAALESLRGAIVREDNYTDVRANSIWLLGGPMAPMMVATVRKAPAGLQMLATSMAARALWGSEEFWAVYRRRFMDRRASGVGRWALYAQAPEHRVELLFVPAAH